MQLKDTHAIRHRYDYVYISPHFDDVAASCGGRILNQKQAGKSVLVVTVFSARANRATRVNNRALQAMLDYDRRRLEDMKAMQLLGVDFLWLDFPEVLFRRQPSWRRYGITYPDTDANKRLCHQITIQLAAICKQTQCVEMMLPLGIGQHVDHQILFQTGLSRHQNSLRQHAILFYEEMPYALFPFLRNYRLKKIFPGAIGLRHPHQIKAFSSQLPTKKLVYLLTDMPSLGLHHVISRPWIFLLLKVLDLGVRYLVRHSKTYFIESQIKPHIEDISSVIDLKVAAISAYGSQLHDAGPKSQTIKKWLAAYANCIGMAPASYGELYWRVR